MEEMKKVIFHKTLARYWEEGCSIFFLEVAGNTGLGKTDVGKYAISSHFFIVKMLEPNSRSKHTTLVTNYFLVSAPAKAKRSRNYSAQLTYWEVKVRPCSSSPPPKFKSKNSLKSRRQIPVSLNFGGAERGFTMTSFTRFVHCNLLSKNIRILLRTS